MKKYLVTWCGGSRRVAGLKAAHTLARTKSAKYHDRGGCSGATVWRERRGGGEAVLVCRAKRCRRTGWLQSGNPYNIG